MICVKNGSIFYLNIILLTYDSNNWKQKLCTSVLFGERECVTFLQNIELFDQKGQGKGHKVEND